MVNTNEALKMVESEQLAREVLKCAKPGGVRQRMVARHTRRQDRLIELYRAALRKVLDRAEAETLRNFHREAGEGEKGGKVSTRAENRDRAQISLKKHPSSGESGTVQAGAPEGHEFYGNQWSENAGGDEEKVRTERLAANWVERYSWDKTLKRLPNIASYNELAKYKPTEPVTLYRFEREDHDESKAQTSKDIPFVSWTHDKQMAQSIVEDTNAGGGPKMVLREKVFKPDQIYTDFTKLPKSITQHFKKGASNMQEVLVWKGQEPRSSSNFIRAAGSVVPVAVDFLFTLTDFKQDLNATVRTLAQENMWETARGVLADLGVDEQLATPGGLIEKFAIQRTNNLKDVPQEVYDEIKRKLEAGAVEGESIEHMADRIRNVFDETYKGRMETVARTEALSMYNKANHEALTLHGWKYKTWSTSLDDNVRDAHAEMEGVTVPIDEPFTVTGPKGEEDEVMFPGDPEGEAWNCINCRCTLLASDSPEGPSDELEPEEELGPELEALLK